MLERQPIQKLHHDEWLAILMPDFIDRADIGMVEGRGRLRLSLEAGQCLGILGDVIGQKLQGDKPTKGYVLGLIDNAHPAAADLFHNAVVRDCLADHAQACYGGTLDKSMKAMEFVASQEVCWRNIATILVGRVVSVFAWFVKRHRDV